nr:uncharacterized protein LOC117229026 [Megalopta genalis]
MYMSYPSPRILSEAVKADLRYIIQGGCRDWNVPEDIRPDPCIISAQPARGVMSRLPQREVTPGLPTANLLGWSRATTLSSDQRTHIEDAGITVDDFGGEGRFLLNRVLIEKVHDALNNSFVKMKLGGSLCEKPMGSIVQSLHYERDLSQPYHFSRTQQYLESEIRGSCAQQLDRRVVAFGHIFGFRCLKNGTNEREVRHPWSIYDWGNYVNVPPSWVASRNTVFTYGHGDRLNMAEFVTPYSGRDNIRT